FVSCVPGLTVDESPEVAAHLQSLRPGQASILPNFREHPWAESVDAARRRDVAHNILYGPDGQFLYAAVMQDDFDSTYRATENERESPSTRLVDIPEEAGGAFAGPRFIAQITALEPVRAMEEDNVVVSLAGNKVADKIILSEKLIQKMRLGHTLMIRGLIAYTV